jgi:hypothetical protein
MKTLLLLVICFTGGCASTSQLNIGSPPENNYAPKNGTSYNIQNSNDINIGNRDVIKDRGKKITGGND